MFADDGINREIDPKPEYPEEIGKALSQGEDASGNGTKVEIIHKFTLGEQTRDQGLSCEIRTTVTSDLVNGTEQPASATQSMLVVHDNEEKETLLINIDDDMSDTEYGVVLFIDYEALESLDIKGIDEKDFEGYEVMFAAVKAAKNGKEAFEAQEPFWKKRFIAEILKKN